MIDPFYLITDPLTYRSVLIIAILLLLLMSLVSLAVMIGHKTYVELLAAREARLRNGYEEEVSVFLDGGKSSLSAPMSLLARDALADVVISRLARVERACGDRLRAELRRVGIVDHLLGRLRRSRSWVRRFRALERLGFLRYPDLRPVFLELLSGEGGDPLITSKTLWALSFVATAEDLPTIIGYLGDASLMSAKFNEYIFTNLVGGFRAAYGDEETVALLERLLADEAMPVLLKRDMVEACGKMKFSRSERLVDEAFRRYREVPEMRITAVRAAGEMASGSLCAILPDSLGDPDWRVRVVASHYAHLCPEAAITRLEELVRDQSYHVRINAARALGRLGSKGDAALRRASAGDDRFARDMCRYILSGKP